MALAGVETEALGSYSEANAADPGLTRLRDKLAIDFQSGWPHTLAEMEVELADGSHFEARHDAGIPAADIARQGERLEQKFAALVEPLLGARADEIVAAARRMDELADIRGLMALCA